MSYKVSIENRCNYCGVGIRKRNKFCSHKCYTDSLRDRVDRTCKGCAKVFGVTKITIEKRGGIFCNNDCQKKYWDKNRKTRQEVLDVYNNKPETKLRVRHWKEKKHYDGNATITGKDCAMCGMQKNRMAIHHIDGQNGKHGKELNNDATNLVVLCQSCHVKIHNRYGLKEVVFSNV